MRLGLEIFQKALGETQTDGGGAWLQRGQGAVVKAAAVAQPVPTRAIPDTGHKQQRRHDHLGVFGLGDAKRVFFHGAARVPGVEGQRLVHLVHHGQGNTAALGFVQQFAVFLPAVQGGQGVKLAFDGPISANYRVGAPHQPDPHHALQLVRALQAVGHIQALFDKCLPDGKFVHNSPNAIPEDSDTGSCRHHCGRKCPLHRPGPGCQRQRPDRNGPGLSQGGSQKTGAAAAPGPGPCAGAVGRLLGAEGPPGRGQPAGGGRLLAALRRHLPRRPPAQRLAAAAGQTARVGGFCRTPCPVPYVGRP